MNCEILLFLHWDFIRNFLIGIIYNEDLRILYLAMMISIWTAIVAFVTFCYAVNTAAAGETYKNVKTKFEFVLVQQYVGDQINIIENEKDFELSLGAHIMTTFNASIEDIKISPEPTWETVDISYILTTNLESTYSLAVRDNMDKVIGIGEYFISYNGVVFKSKDGSLSTKESWKETWYEIGHQVLYAAIVAIVAISIFAVAVHYTCRWGKRRPTTEGRYVLNETPRTSRALSSGDNPYAQEMTSDDIVQTNETDVEMNGHAQSNGAVSSNEDKIEMNTVKEETPQVNGNGAGAENKGFEKEENSMFAKLVYSEYSVPAKHSHEFL